MFCLGIRTAAAVAIVFSCVLSVAPAMADSQQDHLSDALQAMHDWVGSSENGKRWKAYLRSDDLLRELAKGYDADVVVAEKILAQYQSKTGGLDRTRFVAVRKALAAWLQELKLPTAAELPQVARAAKDHFQPVTAENLAAAKTALLGQVKALDAYLASGGENGAAWKKYLKWDKLQSQLAVDAAPELKSVSEVYRRYRANHPGLEMPVFTNVAEALQCYYDLAAVKLNPKASEQFASELDTLATRLEKYAQAPAETENLAIGRRLGWLEGSHQAGTLVQAVRRHYSRPNLSAQVSKEFLDAGMGRTVDDTSSITDDILGTKITGEGHTLAKLDVALVPNNRYAQLSALLAGRVMTETVGSNGPVFIFTDGEATFAAEKSILIDDKGFHVKPAVCKASITSDIHGISTTRDGRMGERMIRKVAWKRIGKQRGRAEKIAEEHAARRVEERFDREANPQLTKANKNFNDDFRKPLLRLGEFPQLLRFSSSEDHLFVQSLQANRYQLGAPTNPPEHAGDADLSVRVHETWVNNLAGAVLAGKTFTDADQEKMGKRLGGEWEEKLKSDADDDPWSITYAASRPVTLSFDENRFSVTIRGRRFTSGERSFKAMDITAVYHLEKTATGAKLTRQGELRIFPPHFVEGKNKLSASQVALRRLLNKRMGKLFPPEILADSKELSGEWAK
ncbi:MAG: hypothetical protein ACC645_24530, partial [Pirellulales bacterium]